MGFSSRTDPLQDRFGYDGLLQCHQVALPRENPEVVQLFGGNTDKLERELERMARRKFKLASMQHYSKSNKEEHENAEFLLRAYPDLQIAYLKGEPLCKEGGGPRIFSSLI